MRYCLGDRNEVIGQGEVHLCRPGEWHAGTNNRMTPCLLYWFEVIPDQLLPSGVGKDFFSHVTSGKLRLAGDWLRDMAEEILEEYVKKLPAWEATITCLMRLLLIRLVRAWEFSIVDPVEPRFSVPVRNVIAVMRQELLKPTALPALLATSKLQHSAIHERFRRETGFSPNEYRLRLKVNMAQELLRNRRNSVTEIAYRLNFSSSQYFSSVFKKITGYSPRYWREHFRYGS